jgi:signal transduction histidine kinase
MMRTWLRGKPGGLAIFAVIAALVAGGLGWVTLAALRLEREQCEARAQADYQSKLRASQRLRDQEREALRRQHAQQEAQAKADYAAKLRLALWRLDSRIAPFLAREDTRPYNHFSALYAPAVVLDRAGNRQDTPVVLEPSPLLNNDLPDWMLLHFQTAEGTWGSPQVLSSYTCGQLARNSVNVTNVTPRRAHLLEELADPGMGRTLMSLVKCEDLRLLAGRDVQPPAESPGAQPIPAPVQANKDMAQLVPRRMADYGYASRAQQRNQTVQETRPQNFDDNAFAAWQNTANYKSWDFAVPGRTDTSKAVLVNLSPMVPVWLTRPGSPEQLLVARLVRIVPKLPDYLGWLLTLPKPGLAANVAVVALSQRGKPQLAPPTEACQGIVLDWPRLQSLLAGEVRDLFPEARFRPMRDEVPPHPERTMTALPVEMDPGPGAETAAAKHAEPVLEPEPLPSPPEPTALGWTPLRIGLALSWAAALVGLVTVGLGGWSLIDLSQRRFRFVSAVTHELRTPLTTLRLYLDMLTGGMVQGEKRRAEYLHTLNTETDRLNRLVGNVLDFSRLENQRPRLDKAPVLVADLLEQVRATWKTRCLDGDKELVVSNEVAAEMSLVTDVQLVQQILGNLIDNACKYSRGAADRRIWLRARRAGPDGLVLEVEDGGPGVPPRERNAIFRPFHRGHDADTTAGGVGLGLALAQRWAQLLGGTLRLERALAAPGACFRLDLPLNC